MGRKDTLTDRVRLPFTFDAAKMLEEINAFTEKEFTSFNASSIRGPAHVMDPSLPAPPPADDYADGSWTKWKNSSNLDASPYLLSVLDTFAQHTTVNLVRILRLGVGEVVPEHSDPTLALHIERSMIRLTLPIVSDEGVEYLLNNKHVPMQPGECWYLRHTDKHKVTNNSTKERINITIDMIPNNWVRKTIVKAEKKQL